MLLKLYWKIKDDLRKKCNLSEVICNDFESLRGEIKGAKKSGSELNKEETRKGLKRKSEDVFVENKGKVAR